MDQDSNDFLENVKALAIYKHLKHESLKNSAKLGSLMSESGKFSLNTYSKLVYLSNLFIKVTMKILQM